MLEENYADRILERFLLVQETMNNFYNQFAQLSSQFMTTNSVASKLEIIPLRNRLTSLAVGRSLLIAAIATLIEHNRESNGKKQAKSDFLHREIDDFIYTLIEELRQFEAEIEESVEKGKGKGKVEVEVEEQESDVERRKNSVKALKNYVANCSNQIRLLQQKQNKCVVVFVEEFDNNLLQNLPEGCCWVIMKFSKRQK